MWKEQKRVIRRVRRRENEMLEPSQKSAKKATNMKRAREANSNTRHIYRSIYTYVYAYIYGVCVCLDVAQGFCERAKKK